MQIFLNLHGYSYLRLDGTTKPEQRQILMQRFNTNPKIFVFILSTRSGGVGMNLTGGDTVIFYDSDWNPAMDAQVSQRDLKLMLHSCSDRGLKMWTIHVCTITHAIYFDGPLFLILHRIHCMFWVDIICMPWWCCRLRTDVIALGRLVRCMCIAWSLRRP